MPLPLAMGALAAPRTYKLTTTSRMRMNEAEEHNVYHTVARQTLLERKPNNTYRLAIEVLSFEAEKPSFFTALAADLNQVSNSLIIQTDIYGRLERIENRAEMLKTWQRIKSEIVRKYAKQYTKVFFEAFGQNIQLEGVFEKTLRHKGLHGVLLPGLYGYGYTPEAPVTTRRVLEQFINQVDLPLLMTTIAQPATPTDNELQLQVTGTLNEAAFRDDDLRRLFRAMADNPQLNVALSAASTESYQFDNPTGWLRTAKQHLLAEVPGIYRNETQHELQTAD